MVLLRFDRDSKKWIKIDRKDKVETDIYLDNGLKKCIDHYKLQQKRDNDRVVIISGDEGSGKSSLMGTIIEYVSDGDFDPKKHLIGANYLDGLEKIEKAKRRGILGFDEGNSFFLATETTKTEHRDLHKLFSIFRQKNLFVVICLPGFFRLGTYFAIDRSASLIRTYEKNLKRGFFAFYGKKGKDLLYRIGKKDSYNIHAVSPRFRGRFLKCFKLENKEYKVFKMSTLSTEIKKAKEKTKKNKTEGQIKRERDVEMISNNMEKPNKELAELIGKTDERVRQLKHQIRGNIDQIQGVS